MSAEARVYYMKARASIGYNKWQHFAAKVAAKSAPAAQKLWLKKLIEQGVQGAEIVRVLDVTPLPPAPPSDGRRPAYAHYRSLGGPVCNRCMRSIHEGDCEQPKGAA